MIESTPSTDRGVWLTASDGLTFTAIAMTEGKLWRQQSSGVNSWADRGRGFPGLQCKSRPAVMTPGSRVQLRGLL